MTNNPFKEALKEGARWLIFFVIGWLITETLGQLSLVPEYATVKIYVFSYLIPVRATLSFLLTMAGKMADKYRFQSTKNNPLSDTKGILPF